MPITTDQLTHLLSGVSGQTFTLSAQQLDVETVTQLFTAYLPAATLTIQDARADVNKLTISGQMTLGNAQNVPCTVDFLKAGNAVSGIAITLSLSAWELQTPFVTFPGNLLRDYGFQHPHLILQAGGGDPATSAPKATLDASLQIQTSAGPKTATLVAQIPPVSNPYQKNLIFQAPFNGVTFADLTALKQFVHNANFAVIPAGIPVASSLELQLLRVVLDPSDNEIVSLQVDLRSNEGLKVVPGVFEISEFLFSLDVLFPTTSAELYPGIGASLTIYDQKVNAWFSIPEVFFEGEIDYNPPLPLKSFVAHFLPTDGLENFSISSMELGLGFIDPYGYTLEIALTDLWHVSLGPRQLEVQALQILLEGAGKAAPDLTIKGEITFAGVTLYLAAQYANGWTFEADTVALSAIDIGTMLAELVSLSGAIPATLPPEIPSLALSSLNIATSPNGVFDVAARCISTWDLPFGVTGLAVSAFDFALHRSPGSGGVEQVTCSIKLHSDGPVTIVEGLIFNSMDLSFDLVQQTKSWTLSGSVSATLFGTAVTFSASLTETPALRTITLRASNTSTSPLIDLGSVGSLTGSDLLISISKPLQAGTNPGGVSLNSSSAYIWLVQVTGGITLTNVFTLDGMLTLARTATATSLVFQPTTTQVAISLPDPLQTWSLYLGLEYLSFVGSTDSQGKRTWSFSMTTATWFGGLPTNLQSILPSASSKINGSFTADSSKVQLSVDRLTQPVAFAIPSSHSIDLGEAMIDLSNLDITLGHAMSLSVDIGCGLPEKLNTIFGTKGDGSPVLSLFNTYVPGNAASVTKLTMRLNSSGGLQVVPITSPLKAVTFTSDGTNSWCDADLGEFGAFRFMVPVFSYSVGTFTGAGGMTVLRPLKVPLTPMKWLLDACGLSAVANMLPDGLAVQELKIYDSAAGHFDSAALISFIEGMHVPLESVVQTAIQAMEQQLEKLPDRFKSYLDIVLPTQFNFTLAVSSTGSVRGGFQVDRSTPIKLLYPTLGLLGPQLNGIELYGFSFGELLDGTLLQLTLDMVMDQFNLLTLIAALALPLDKLSILPRSQDLATTITIHNLYMLIIYETVIPIPIPLFYDDLGLDYLGLEGLTLQTHWSFPKPSLSPTDAGAIFTNFKQFFTDHSYLLDANVPPQKMDLVLTIGPNYLQLPAYLGGSALGSKTQKIVLSAYEGLAHLLNALKTLSLNELIQALPLADRVGKETVSFACMTLEVAWLITTPQEFRSISYKQLNVVESDISTLLQVVPPAPAKDDQGLVIFLQGSWQLSTIVGLNVTFGLIGTDGGFGTGLHMGGNISNMLAIDLSAVVIIDPKLATPFNLSGHSTLAIAGRTVFTGDVQIDSQHFFLSGQLALFPPSSPLQIGGGGQAQIDNQGQFLLQTAVNVSLQNFVLLGSQITISNTGLTISATWLGRTVTFSIVIQGNDFTLSGSVAFDLGLNINVGPIYDNLTGLKVVDQLSLNTTLSASLAISLGTLGFAADVTASFSWNSFHLTVPGFHIVVSPQDIAALTDLLVQEIEQHVSDIFAGAFKSMADWLKAGVNGLIQVTSEWQPAVTAAGKWSSGAWNATEQWTSQSWQTASQWSTSAWNATTSWSDDDWNATTHWSSDTWNSTKTWSISTWNATASWSTDQFNDAATTASNLMRSLHTDTSTPHIDTAAQHVDTPSTVHVDVAAQHADTHATPHADVAAQHIDTPATAHVDVAAQHADTPAAPHADVAAQHADTPSKAHVDVAAQHADTPSTSHADIAAQHADTTITPHGDTHVDVGFTGTHADVPRVHADTTATPHIDTATIPHIDASITPHADTSAIPHIDGSVTPHIDTATIPHIDGSTTPHIDTRAVPHVDGSATPHIDTVAIPHIDASTTPHVDTNAIPHIDQTVPHSDLGAQHVDVTP